MTVKKYDPKLSHFDIDLARGKQGELFVHDIQRMLAEKTGEIEIKADYRFSLGKRFYVETDCRKRNGKWEPSGINVTKAKIWFVVCGTQKPDMLLPLGLVVSVEKMKRAVELAARFEKNKVACNYGENPTRGVLVYPTHIISAVLEGIEEEKEEAPLPLFMET